ncbi:hypothetical protein GCM10018952_41260 [Streptosporangium vulgare]
MPSRTTSCGPDAGQVGVAEGDGAGVGAVDPRDAVEQGRLPGAVGTDEPADLSGGDGEADPVQGRDAAEAERHVRDREGGPLTGFVDRLHLSGSNASFHTSVSSALLVRSYYNKKSECVNGP